MDELERVMELAENEDLEIARQLGKWWVTVKGTMYSGITLEDAVNAAEDDQRRLSGKKTE